MSALSISFNDGNTRIYLEITFYIFYIFILRNPRTQVEFLGEIKGLLSRIKQFAD